MSFLVCTSLISNYRKGVTGSNLRSPHFRGLVSALAQQSGYNKELEATS